ncbi:growth arrest-specific protein 1-like [Dendronephthya gigantea]|uniref:growth arrest-specific protein 1-like n=1 Tax=Dendronephthya gigantea TaxID=151771 RepID=UPI001069E165|nr:growth arrest-specific protein 1-like [Dendronephthya gigantea]
MYRIILPFVFGFFQVLNANNPSNNCITAFMKCEEDVFNCAIEYGRFLTACDLRVTPTSTRNDKNLTRFVVPPFRKPCNHECVRAIRRLKRTKRGKALQKCDCHLDGKCLSFKARVAKCLNTTTRHRPTISCTLALLNCSLDQKCASLQEQFLRDCHHMINGVQCEKKCQDIQQRLYKEAKNLADCECDGPTEAYCRAIRAHSKQLRCEPGMDRNGTPAFTYIEDTKIHGGSEIKEPTRAVGIRQGSSRTLLALLLMIFLL